jgi:phage shock protein E
MKKIFCSIFILCFVVSYAQCEIQKDVVIDGNSKIIDVRTEKEYKLGHLKNAINIPYTEIKEKIKEYVWDKEEKIILYCQSGRRAGIAEKILKEMGYKNVINAGAYEKLKKKEEEKEKRK